MPVKQVTCSICKQTVNKAQTFAIADGTRACRSHSEAQQAADQRKQEEMERMKAANAKTPAQLRREKWQSEFGNAPREFSLNARCFCCGREGLHQQDFYLRILMAMEKMDLLDDRPLPWLMKDGQLVSNPDYSAKIREYMKSPDMQGDHIYVCLSLVTMEQNRQIKSHIRHDARFAADMTGIAMVCPTCVKKYRVEVPQPLKEISFEQLTNWAVVAEQTKPLRQAMAMTELAGTKS